MTKEEQKAVIAILDVRVDVISFATRDQPAQLRVQGTVDERLIIDHITGTDGGNLSSAAASHPRMDHVHRSSCASAR